MPSSMVKQLDVHKQFAQYFNDSSIEPLLYLVSKKLTEGHICVAINTINIAELEEADYNYIPTVATIQASALVSNGSTPTPFVLQQNNFYIQRYYNYETNIVQQIQHFITAEKQAVTNNVKTLLQQTTLIQNLFSNSNTLANTNWQMAAVIMALQQNFTIITGGPGTGKTSTVAKILTILLTSNNQLKIALTAPTGKAAARMGEALQNANASNNVNVQQAMQKLEPATIHRLLGSIKNSIHYKHNSQNTLPYNVIIVDEASMIDVTLFAKLLLAIAPTTKVILLGDKDQLASVEAGSLFGDLCKAQLQVNMFSQHNASTINNIIPTKQQQINTTNITNNSNNLLFEHVIELQHSYRFNDAEGIGKLSKAVIHNNENIIKSYCNNNDEQVYIDQLYNNSIFENFVLGYKDYIQEPNIAKAIEKLNNLRVLCAVREGEQGLYALNKKIEIFLQKQNLILTNTDFYENRPIMVTSNSATLQLFNGDIGIIRHDENNVAKAYFINNNNEIKSVAPSFLTNVETVFVTTIHKSQGSEFDTILICLPDSDSVALLTRELLYTAITRAKKHVTIQATEQILLQTAAAQVQRASGIANRFTIL